MCGQTITVPPGQPAEAGLGPLESTTDPFWDDVSQCTCGQAFAARPELYGKTVACPSCGSALTVPNPAASADAKIPVACACGQRFNAPSSLAGKRVACPVCQQAINVPAGAPDVGLQAVSSTADSFWDGIPDVASAPAANLGFQGTANPYSAPQTLATPRRSGGGPRDELRKIAIYQKGIQVAVLFYLLAVFFSFVPFVPLRVLLGLGMIYVITAGPIFVFLLSMKVYGVWQGIVFAILMFVPCLGLIMLLIVNQKATSMLQAKGISVGLLGARLSEI